MCVEEGNKNLRCFGKQKYGVEKKICLFGPGEEDDDNGKEHKK